MTPDRTQEATHAGVTLGNVRAWVQELPEVTEQDHHGISSFRVRGRIFVTLPDDTHLRAMVDETEIRATVAENPTVCHELYWGKRLSCVVVDLPHARPQLVEELLTEAWTAKAPRSLSDRIDRL
jgi:hypothetical protein